MAAPEGAGGGGTSGTVTRFETGPFRPRVERPKATYVRTGTIGGGPSNGPSAAATAGCPLPPPPPFRVSTYGGTGLLFRGNATPAPPGAPRGTPPSDERAPPAPQAGAPRAP